MKRVAVVGSGISGMVSAWLFSQSHEVHLFERASRLGGHTNTIDVARADGTRRGIDTGFITYNEPTYPNFTRLLHHLGVTTQTSDMSWSLTCAHCDITYAGNPRGAIPNRQALRPSHIRMLVEIGRFNRLANRMLVGTIDPHETLASFLTRQQFSHAFSHHYLLPMAAAIWSTGPRAVGRFPLATFLTFFRNHGLLGVTTHHQWRSVVGGSAAYITPLTRPYAANIHLNSQIATVGRTTDAATVQFADGSRETFDAIVFATHADDALALLDDPSGDERELLGMWRYSDNEVVLHTDTSFLPPSRRAWASWNYLQTDCTNPDTRASLSYHMNRLQRLDEPTDYIVTLNPTRPVAAHHVITQVNYRHPAYTREAVESQHAITALNGTNRTAYAGAYLRYGFHEDGVVSAINAADAFGVPWPL